MTVSAFLNPLRQFLVLAGLLLLAACGSPSGVFVSPDAIPVGGNLFIEDPTNKEGQLLVLDGGITERTSYVFQSLVEGGNDINGLVITQSPGGDLNAAHQIGREIRRNGINTMVLLECSSACSDIFVAGRNRYVSDAAVFYLHPASDPEYGYSIDKPYWTALGFSELNDRVYRMKQNELWRIDAQEALRLRMATEIIPLEELANPGS